MLPHAYFLAKIGADTAENEQHFAEICQKLATTLRVRRADPAPSASASAASAYVGSPTQLSNCLTLKGSFSAGWLAGWQTGLSFSAVSKTNVASKYALESSRRDLQNALLGTVLVGSVWVKKYTKINIEKMKNAKVAVL